MKERYWWAILSIAWLCICVSAHAARTPYEYVCQDLIQHMCKIHGECID